MSENEKSIFDKNETMVICAFRYCLGRQTYAVQDCVEWLTVNWDKLKGSTKAVIANDLQYAFDRDDADRRDEKAYCYLGADFDRKEWEKIQALVESI